MLFSIWHNISVFLHEKNLLNHVRHLSQPSCSHPRAKTGIFNFMQQYKILIRLYEDYDLNSDLGS